MTDITDRLRARRVTNWVHGTGETPVAAGFANDTLCCLAAAEIERLRAERPWVGLTDEDLEFWTEELGQGDLGRGVLRAVVDYLKDKNV